MTEVQAMAAEVQGMVGKRSCAIGDEACWSGSKKGKRSCSKSASTDPQSESEIEIVGDEYEEEEEEARVFTAEEMAEYFERQKLFWELDLKTSRYQEAYNECFKRSQGFDLPDSDIEESLSEGECPMDQITKCGKSAFGPDGDVGQAALWALREQNKLMNTNLELVEVVKANALLVSGVIYFITLVAQDNVTSERNTYRAKVHEPFHGDSELMLFSPVDAQGDKKVA